MARKLLMVLGVLFIMRGPGHQARYFCAECVAWNDERDGLTCAFPPKTGTSVMCVSTVNLEWVGFANSITDTARAERKPKEAGR